MEAKSVIQHKFKLASRANALEKSIVRVDGVGVGGRNIAVIAGPCSVESEEQLLETAIGVRKAGARILRASIFKPRTSPYDFQGLGIKGLEIIERVKQETRMAVETEVMHPDHVALVEPFVDAIRIGSRNMQNFDLLKEAGKSEKPVILKRGLSATITEFLLAAEYILNEGNSNVILCERGIRTFVTETRNTLDLNCVPLVKSLCHLPIIADPSHGTGDPDLVIPMSKAAIAAGADGLMVEVHRNPREALSDAHQQVTVEKFAQLMREIKPVASAVGRAIEEG